MDLWTKQVRVCVPRVSVASNDACVFVCLQQATGFNTLFYDVTERPRQSMITDPLKFQLGAIYIFLDCIRDTLIVQNRNVRVSIAHSLNDTFVYDQHSGDVSFMLSPGSLDPLKFSLIRVRNVLEVYFG